MYLLALSIFFLSLSSVVCQRDFLSKLLGLLFVKRLEMYEGSRRLCEDFVERG